MGNVLFTIKCISCGRKWDIGKNDVGLFFFPFWPLKLGEINIVTCRKCHEEDEVRKEEQQKRREEQRRREEQQRIEEERRRQEEQRRREEQQRIEEERRRQEEQRRREEQWRLWKQEQIRQEQEARRREEQQRIEQERRRQEEQRRREEQQRIEEERRRQEEQRRREEQWRLWKQEQIRQEQEARRREEQQRIEQERRRQEEQRRREEQQRIEEERRRQEEQRRREEQWRLWKQEQIRQEQEQARKREEERQRRAEEWKKQKQEEIRREREEQERLEQARKREEERQRRAEEWKKKKQEEIRREREEQERLEQARKREEERQRRAEEWKKQKQEEIRREREEQERLRKELNKRLTESQQRAEEQRESLSINISKEHESRQVVLRRHLEEFEADPEPGDDQDQLLDLLSLNCSVPSLCLSQLTADQLKRILSVLEKLLLHEWTSTPPSLSTLQHTQVLITEMYLLFLEIPDCQQSICSQVEYLVESISQSACGVVENLLLAQALYMNLMHFISDAGRLDADAVLIAKRWAEDELSTEQLFLLKFLSSLSLSLQTTVEKASVFILQMEIQCLKLLLSILTDLNGHKSHHESTEMLLRLVQSNQWTPVEALSLLNALSQKYDQEVPITQVLMLLQVHDIPPGWRDEFGRPLIQALDSAGPERFHQDFQKTLRKRNEESLIAALEELKLSWNFANWVIERIKTITAAVLQYSENPPKDKLFKMDPFKCANQIEIISQECLSRLCTAVFVTRGWWPTAAQMVRWCALVLTDSSGELRMVGVDEDPCVTAMFAASRVCVGNKLDFVLSSEGRLEEQTKEWSDFYKLLGFSVRTNMKNTTASYRDTDIVFGTVNDFVADYFQGAIEALRTGNAPLRRGLIIEEQGLHASHNLEFSRFRDNDSLVVAAEVLQSLMDKFQSLDMEHRIIKVLFQVLHAGAKRCKIITILNKTGKRFFSSEFIVLNVLEEVLKMVSEETQNEENGTSAALLCVEVLFDYVERLQTSEGQTKEVFQMVSDLGAQRLWSPVDALKLLGALTDRHHDEGCVSIMKILHLIITYQVSSKWTDEKNLSLLQLLDSYKTASLIQHLEKNLRDEKMKSIGSICDEIRHTRDVDEQSLIKTEAVVTHVTNLIRNQDIKKFTDLHRARSLSHSTETRDLQELLAFICNAVHLRRAKGKWWPRATQMISWCLLALSDTGKLLEMGTGEGKSCVIAMFAVLRVLRGEKVDVVSSSSVLCQRDTEEWTNFYTYFGITADTNTNKIDDRSRKECYQKDIVYGTIDAFAADHLRQIFEMKNVRPNRSYQCVVIDEVDSLLLDQGVQLTYLSSPMVSMQHVNIILAMIWAHVSQYGFLSSGNQTFIRTPPASFFKAIYDSIDTDGSEINDPMDILRIAEENNTVPEGFTRNLYESEKEERLKKLKTVSQDAMVDFFRAIEDYIPYGLTVYTLDDEGLLCLQRRSPYKDQGVQELTFLVLDEGLCCTLYDSEDILAKAIAESLTGKIQYTPCTNSKDKISIPGFLEKLVEKKLSVWVQNAFLAMQLKMGREYVIENNNVCPVDFKSTGIVELNKKWGDGLQQFVEIKHQIKLSTISTVTNYISNIAFFEKYNGKIYGTTGTLGSKTDILFLQQLYPNLSVCKIPTFNRKKLFEVEGSLTTSAEEWRAEIKRAVMAEICSNSYRGGRAALVICETINEAQEIYEELKSSIPTQPILYCRNDRDTLSNINKELLPGDVIVATNLAGRGTDIKLSKLVNDSGGLFVVLSFLSENTRVELQAFGRTARKGEPGSAQVIMSTEHLQQSFRTAASLEEAKRTRDRIAGTKIKHMMNDVAELKLREDLFSEYLHTLQHVHQGTAGEEQRAVVAIMNEFWGIWLQTKSEEIDQLKRNELQQSLKADLSVAKKLSQSQSSPCASIYHYIKFGNIALNKNQWGVSTRLFERAMKQDQSWAAIAFYSHAFCTIKKKSGNYLTEARDDLKKAQESLKYLSEESVMCLQFVKMSSASSESKANSDPSSLEKQFTNKCSMLRYYDQNISEAIQKLEELKENGRDGVAKTSSIFSLVSGDEQLKVEAFNLYSQGLECVFSVEEEPRFSWEGLLVFCVGVLQIVGGALLIAFTYGALAHIGMELISEGISDCIYGIEAMVTGEFSWKAWAIQKAVSIAVSLVAFGVGKLVAKGYKGCKMSIKGFGKELKSMPKFLSKQVKEGLSTAATTNMKNALKVTGKTMLKEIVVHGAGKLEEEILTLILDTIKKEVKEKIVKNVRSNMDKQSLATLVDSIVLAQLQNEKQLGDLLKDKLSKRQLLGIFSQLTNVALQPFYEDLSLQRKLNSYFSTVVKRAKNEAKGKAKAVLTAIQAGQIISQATDATGAVLTLSSNFFSNFHQELNKFTQHGDSAAKVQTAELSASDSGMLKEFKQELANNISDSLADVLVQVFHQKFSCHIVSHVQGKVNGIISNYVSTKLKTDRTEQKLRAGQNNRYISHMPVRKTCGQEPAGDAGTHSESHAEKIKDPNTPGTVLDIRVLSETTGTKVVILTKNSNGKLTKVQELRPDSQPASKTLTLIYTPKSPQNPDGHYDILVNNQIVNITNRDKSCLFHAFARGLKPNANENEIAMEAERLRAVEADTLLRNPGQWEACVKRKMWTEQIRGGDRYMLEAAASKKISKKEEREFLKNEVGKVELYKDYKSYAAENPGLGQVINADHQPPVSSVLRSGTLNQNSKLANAMLEVATNSSSPNKNEIENVKTKHGLELITVYVPKEMHKEFPSTKSKAYREYLASTISRDDVEGAFKTVIVGSMPRCKLNNSHDNFQNNHMSKTRLQSFEKSFPDHSKKMVETWYQKLEGKGVMTRDNLNNITTWINQRGYMDQNDPYRKQVSKFCQPKNI